MVWLEQFVSILPHQAQTWVMRHTPQTLEEAVKVMENYKAAERVKARGSVHRREIWKGGGNPKDRLGEDDAPYTLTPSGKGRRMEAQGGNGNDKATGPGATSTSRTTTETTNRDTAGTSTGPRPRCEGIRCFKCGSEGHKHHDCRPSNPT